MTAPLSIDTNSLGPWRTGQPDTARQAALANYPRSGSQRARLLNALLNAEHGLNAWEASVVANISRPHVAHTRLTELAKAGLVVMTDETRPTDTGSAAHVWRATPAAVSSGGES